MPELAEEESVVDISHDGSSCSIELKSVYHGEDGYDSADHRSYRGICIPDEELDEKIQNLYDKRKEVGVLNFQDKKELIRLVRIKNSRRFRKKEKQMK